MPTYAIKTQDLTRRFGDLVAVSKISLSIEKGELFGLLGPNGAGKSTFLKLLTGQLGPTSGKAQVLGLDPFKDPIAVKSMIGIVPEVESPPSFLTAEEYLHYVGLIRNIPDIDRKVGHWIDFLDMGEMKDTPGKDLSKGNKQKLVLAAAFIHEPPLLFLDEPFIGLDPYYQKQVREYLLEYLKRGGTIFMCTHILEIAQRMCTSLAIINRGKVVAQGNVQELTEGGQSLDTVFLRYTRGMSTRR